MQSRELQLRGWIVLRFAGSEINRDSEMVVDTIERVNRSTGHGERAWRSQQQQAPPVRQEEKSWQESMQEWRNEKQQAPPVRQRSQKPRTQQKPEGGMCGVVVLACGETSGNGDLILDKDRTYASFI